MHIFPIWTNLFLIFVLSLCSWIDLVFVIMLLDPLFEVTIWAELSEVQDQPKKEYSTKYWTSNAFSMSLLYGPDDSTGIGLHIRDKEKETTKVI